MAWRAIFAGPYRPRHGGDAGAGRVHGGCSGRSVLCSWRTGGYWLGAFPLEFSFVDGYISPAGLTAPPRSPPPRHPIALALRASCEWRGASLACARRVWPTRPRAVSEGSWHLALVNGEWQKTPHVATTILHYLRLREQKSRLDYSSPCRASSLARRASRPPHCLMAPPYTLSRLRRLPCTD